MVILSSIYESDSKEANDIPSSAGSTNKSNKPAVALLVDWLQVPQTLNKHANAQSEQIPQLIKATARSGLPIQ